MTERERAEKIDKIIACAKEIYSISSAGGAMHIVLDDFNCKDSDLQFCAKWIISHDYSVQECELYSRCMNELMEFSEEERGQILAEHYDKYARGVCK